MESKTCFTFLLLLGITCSVYSDICPPEKDIAPCTCIVEDDELEVYCSGEDLSLDELKRILGVFDKEYSLDLALSGMELGTVPYDYFQGLNVRVLDISHCGMDSLTEEGGEALSGLEDTLEDLTIISSFTEEKVHTKLEMGHLRSLTDLDLSYNAITEVSDDWFAKGPSQLTNLIFSNNGITKIGDKAFANLPNLEELWLDGNRFGELRRSMLPNPAANLYDLQFDNNALTSLPEDFFTGMPSLMSVSLRTNLIKVLPEKTYKPVWEQLESIDLRGNPLDCNDSVLKWMFDADTGVDVEGTCGTPPNRAGMDLMTLIQNKGQS